MAIFSLEYAAIVNFSIQFGVTIVSLFKIIMSVVELFKPIFMLVTKPKLLLLLNILILGISKQFNKALILLSVLASLIKINSYFLV